MCDGYAIGLDRANLDCKKPTEPDAISLCPPILDLLPATASLALFESKPPGPSGPVPTVTMARISTASGLAVSCSLPECERLREEGSLSQGEWEGAWKYLGHGTCGTGHFGDMGL